MIFENSKIYDVLNRIWKYVLPAIGFLWEVLYIVWKIPYGQQIYFTIAGVWGAMAIFLGISKYKWKKAVNGWVSDGLEEGEEAERENDNE